MPFLNPGHLWMIMLLLIVVLIVFGPGRLPEVGSGLGRAINEFRRAASGSRDPETITTDADTPAR